MLHNAAYVCDFTESLLNPESAARLAASNTFIENNLLSPFFISDSKEAIKFAKAAMNGTYVNSAIIKPYSKFNKIRFIWQKSQDCKTVLQKYNQVADSLANSRAMKFS